MGDTPPGGPDAGGGSPMGGVAPPSGDQTPVTPPTGAPMTPQGVNAPGAQAKGRAMMGIALLFMDQAIRALPGGSEDHMHAMKMYMEGIKHFKKQEPIEPSPQGMARPNLPQMPGMGGAGAPGGPGAPMGQPMLPRGPVPAPTPGGM